MKYPAEKRRYCPYCKKHTVQKVIIVKKRKASELTWGQRQFREVLSGYGGYPRPLPDSNKPTKKYDLRFKCKECGKMNVQKAGFRVSKFEIKG